MYVVITLMPGLITEELERAFLGRSILSLRNANCVTKQMWDWNV